MTSLKLASTVRWNCLQRSIASQSPACRRCRYGLRRGGGHDCGRPRCRGRWDSRGPDRRRRGLSRGRRCCGRRRSRRRRVWTQYLVAVVSAVVATFFGTVVVDNLANSLPIPGATGVSQGATVRDLCQETRCKE